MSEQIEKFITSLQENNVDGAINSFKTHMTESLDASFKERQNELLESFGFVVEKCMKEEDESEDDQDMDDDESDDSEDDDDDEKDED